MKKNVIKAAKFADWKLYNKYSCKDNMRGFCEYFLSSADYIDESANFLKECFIYRIKNLPEEKIAFITKMQEERKHSKVKDTVKGIFENGGEFVFEGMTSEKFRHNLMLVDSAMCEIAANALLVYYGGSKSKCKDIAYELGKQNPLGFPKEWFYAHKLKKLLCAVALGMTPATLWRGNDDANGGYIIVTKQGDVLAYHIYNRDFFEEYLLNSTKFDTPSSSRYGFGKIYKKGGENYINLNLQIRFM